MFVRNCWQPRTREEMFELIEQYPWAVVVSNGENGPYATNVPLILDRTRGENGALIGHIAVANAHAEVLKTSQTPSLAIFTGPYSYVTGSWYPKRDMPSTYYYTSVHCYGHARIQTTTELEQWLELLTNRMESAFLDGWKTSDIDHSGITRRLSHIMGFEILIDRIEGKFKLGQDEPKKDAMAVADRLVESPESSHRILSKIVRFYNSDRSEG